MRMVNVHQAKTHLSKILDAVSSGEDIVIAKAGTPVARLIPYVPPKRTIAPPGIMKGKIEIADDFDEPLDGLFECLEEKS